MCDFRPSSVCMERVWCGVTRCVTMQVLLMTDAAPRILSAISTALGSSLSPPVFGCHGDDVNLHHRFSPVNVLIGGAINPWHSTAGAIIQWIYPSRIHILRDHLRIHLSKMREIVHLQAGQCGNQIGAKVFSWFFFSLFALEWDLRRILHRHAPETSNPPSTNSLEATQLCVFFLDSVCAIYHLTWIAAYMIIGFLCVADSAKD